jgi:hypothetical protein
MSKFLRLSQMLLRYHVRLREMPDLLAADRRTGAGILAAASPMALAAPSANGSMSPASRPSATSARNPSALLLQERRKPRETVQPLRRL